MNFLDATTSYESWLRTQVALYEPDLRYKHRQMRLADPFPFFRGTYYRWLQHWPTVCAPLHDAPRVLAVGDLHIENYGTWRDAEGRLVWGINDFDEAAELPYTNDLVRLATSIRIAKHAGSLALGYRAACRAVLRGYRQALTRGGTPFVLEENHRVLRRLATISERAPFRFWRCLTSLLEHSSPVEPPLDVLTAFSPTWPSDTLQFQYRRRERVGVGSLGKPRFVALTQWNGSWIAREAKALTQSANAWATGQPCPVRIHELLQQAVRCHDPFYLLHGRWIVRRLAARCTRIELAHFTHVKDETALLTAMGAEAANLHLGSHNPDAILRDLDRRPHRWLPNAGKAMATIIHADWRCWRKHHP